MVLFGIAYYSAFFTADNRHSERIRNIIPYMVKHIAQKYDVVYYRIILRHIQVLIKRKQCRDELNRNLDDT